MSTTRSRVIQFRSRKTEPASLRVADDARAPDIGRSAEPASVDTETARELQAQLANETCGEETWKLLSRAEQLPARSIDLEIVFQALTRLTQSESVFLRGAAYRWLAGLHQKDLRFEMRAKRLLFLALENETGPALLRVTELLRRC